MPIAWLQWILCSAFPKFRTGKKNILKFYAKKKKQNANGNKKTKPNQTKKTQKKHNKTKQNMQHAQSNQQAGSLSTMRRNSAM